MSRVRRVACISGEMVTPVVGEREWKAALDGLPMWLPPMQKTLVVSPHPDDETLGCGGLIAWLRARGVDVSVVAVTDGENAYAGVSGLGEVREKEQAKALERLGVREIHRLRLVDSSVREDDVTRALMALVDAGTHIVAPWEGDFHPDHETCGRAAKAVAETMRVPLTSYFFWTWHRGTVATVESLHLRAFALGEHEVSAKREALGCHRSQLEHVSGEPILPEYLLKPMARPYEVYLPR